jgi:hypothetical protein
LAREPATTRRFSPTPPGRPVGVRDVGDWDAVTCDCIAPR